MKLFDIFRNQKKDISPAKEDCNKAEELFNNSEFQEALRTLTWGFRKDIDYIPLYELSVKCLENLGGEEEAELFRQVIREPQQFKAFVQLGSHFYEVAHYQLAEPFLEKAVSIDSSDKNTIHDLAIVYARQFQIEKALAVLQKSNYQEDFWDYWFWCKLRILAGKTQGVQEGIEQLTNTLNNEDNQTELEIPRQKISEIAELLQRYKAVEIPQFHIQDWHFIQYGNIILDFFDDTDEYVAGGRYVATWGNNDSVKQITEQLKTCIEILNIDIEQVAYLNDRNSTIIGMLIGLILNLRAKPYQSDDCHNTLIVAANSLDYDNHEELIRIKNGQVLFALNHDWLHSSIISPDISGLMSQSYFFPWDENFSIKEEEIEKIAPDERAEFEIASDIYKEKLEEPIEIEKFDFYLKKRAYLKGIGEKSGDQRFNFMIESPIPGSYFG